MRSLRALPFAAANLAGVGAFAAPFLLSSAPSSEVSARSADAPWLVALLMPLLIGAALMESSNPAFGAKGIALMGVLAGAAALMRVPISFGGANLIFFLPIVSGFVFGVRFGFLLGALSMAASAFITGGLGPWLPFQMWTAGWVGGGAGLLRPVGDRLYRSGKTPARFISILGLALYGYIGGLLFGFVINLYFWPTVPSASLTGWLPGLGFGETVERYMRFYLATSVAWDALRGVGNALVIIIAGRAVADLLRRYRGRFGFEMIDRTALSPRSGWG